MSSIINGIVLDDDVGKEVDEGMVHNWLVRILNFANNVENHFVLFHDDVLNVRIQERNFDVRKHSEVKKILKEEDDDVGKALDILNDFKNDSNNFYLDDDFHLNDDDNYINNAINVKDKVEHPGFGINNVNVDYVPGVDPDDDEDINGLDFDSKLLEVVRIKEENLQVNVQVSFMFDDNQLL